MSIAAAATSTQYHSTGRQPSNEMNRLRDGDDAVDMQGGEDDEKLSQLVHQAESGDTPSMNLLAGLLYWGHRGFTRDQVRARALWDDVATIGDTLAGFCYLTHIRSITLYLYIYPYLYQIYLFMSIYMPLFISYTLCTALDPHPLTSTNGRVAAAGMWLKGEGGDANHSRAVELYEKAASQGSVGALNGLGFAYFYGNNLPQVFIHYPPSSCAIYVW